MEIIKHCKCCGNQFIAHRMATLYCSKACNAKATRVRKKKSIQQEYQELQNDLDRQLSILSLMRNILAQFKQQNCLE